MGSMNLGVQCKNRGKYGKNHTVSHRGLPSDTMMTMLFHECSRSITNIILCYCNNYSSLNNNEIPSIITWHELFMAR